MTRLGLQSLLQLTPGDITFAWYLAGFLLVLLLIALGLALFLLRTEIGEQAVDSEQLVNAFEEPVVILDPDDTVLLANVPFRTIFGSEISGESIEAVFDSHPTIRDAVDDRTEATVELEHDDGTRQYHLQMYSIGKQPRPPQKWIVLFRDITEHHEREAQLKAENEQLDQFASLISHDLRNPLDVAIGRTNAVAEVIDDPELKTHLARAQDSHERMKSIITDVLTLSQDGYSIGDTEPVPMETAAMDAWSHVDTERGSFDVDTQLVIRADPNHLERILENLFRNAIQHAGTDVRVTVGELAQDDGFYVADDGPGIPPADRETIFEPGYTGDGNGTGLGLAIVVSIAEAHGWGTRVTTAENGGARFEFTGVDLVSDDQTAQPVE